MATVGQQLTAPEAGWRRYDDRDPRIIFTGGWQLGTPSGNYNTTNRYIADFVSTGTVRFKFRGTKFIIIASTDNNRPQTESNIVYVDGVEVGRFSQYTDDNKWQIVTYQQLNLKYGDHLVEIYCGGNAVIDAIDIDADGKLLHPYLPEKSNIADMEIGDVIPCRYIAPSGKVGFFSELGTCDMSEIPVNGAAAPDGLFYFIKVDKGLLIADRVVQHSITWDTLNSGGLIEGRYLGNNIIPIMTSNTEPSGVASASAYSEPDYPWKAFDRNRSGSRDFWYIAGNWIPGGNWVQYDFGELRTVIAFSLQSFHVSSGSHSIRTFKLLGSNDGVNFDIIYEGSFPNSFATITYFLKSPVTYQIYRVQGFSHYSEDYFGIREFELFDNVYFMRSLTGGIGHAIDEEKSGYALTHQGFGGYPNNEWDKYIVLSDLRGKISPGDDRIWHWSGVQTWCKETPIVGMRRSFDSLVGSANTRTHRSQTNTGAYNLDGYSFGISYYSGITVGFRPVLEYIEPDGSTRQKTFWY